MGTDFEMYKIIVERHLNDDRLLHERGSIFIASGSILFTGFAVLAEWDSKPLLLIICVLGVALSILAIRANYRTSQGLEFWEGKESQLEASKEELFTYMREHNMMPSQMARGCLRNRHIYTWYIPIAFIILWVSAFVWVLC